MKLNEASVLLVDDEPVILHILNGWFRRKAGRVFCAENGMEALQVLAANKVDLIISDISMPVMDGLHLLKQVNAVAMPAPGRIFITGFTDIEAREIYDLGVKAILEKPIEYDDTLNVAERSLADRNELWQTPLAPGHFPLLTRSFESLTAALKDQQIAFGRGGFCIQTDQLLAKGPVKIELNFKADQYVLSGEGMVRWLAPEERQMGIELIYVAEAARARALQLTEHSTSFIPGTTGRTVATRASSF
jgi:CheY-like chemotaxis protein